MQGISGTQVSILGKGDVPVIMYAKNSTNTLTLKNCFHILSNVSNLVSIGQFIQAGSNIQMKQNSMELHTPNNQLLCTASLKGTQFILNMHMANQSKVNAATALEG